MNLYCLHGNFGLPGDWFDLEQRLRGFGLRMTFRAPHLWEDPGLSSSDSPAAWAERFNRIVRAESGRSEGQGPRAIILGYSMGGRLAMEALVQEPHLWSGAILISSHPCDLTAEERDNKLRQDQIWARRFRDRGESWELLMQSWNSQPVFSGNGEAPERREQDFDRQQIADGFEAWSAGRMSTSLVRVGELGLPVLWLVGQRDAGLLQRSRGLRGRLSSKVELRELAAGHRVPWDAPAELAAEVRSFLSQFA